MDWPRAKTILITAFALLNAFLIYRVWEVINLDESHYLPVTVEQIREVSEELAAEGIELAAPVPRKAPPMAFLVLAHAGPEKQGQEPGPGKEGEKPDQTAGGTQGKGQAPGTLNANTARRLAEGFIETKGGFPPASRFDGVVFLEAEGLYLVRYYQEFDGWPVFGGRIEVKLSTDGRVVDFQRTWLKPLGYSGPRKGIIPATEALGRLNALLKSRDSGEKARPGAGWVIREIDLGYYSRIYDANQWEAPPVWRIRMEGGDTFYVNAYTGEREPSE